MLEVNGEVKKNAMFRGCKSFNKDISNWNVSKVKNHILMSRNCTIKDEYKPKFI